MNSQKKYTFIQNLMSNILYNLIMKNITSSDYCVLSITFLGLLCFGFIFCIVFFIDSGKLIKWFYLCLIFFFLVIGLAIYKLAQLAKEYKKEEMKVFEQSLFLMERLLKSNSYALDKQAVKSNLGSIVDLNTKLVELMAKVNRLIQELVEK